MAQRTIKTRIVLSGEAEYVAGMKRVRKELKKFVKTARQARRALRDVRGLMRETCAESEREIEREILGSPPTREKF